LISFLSKAAIEVAVCSKYLLEAIVGPYRATVRVSWIRIFSIVLCVGQVLCEIAFGLPNA